MSDSSIKARELFNYKPKRRFPIVLVAIILVVLLGFLIAKFPIIANIPYEQ